MKLVNDLKENALPIIDLDKVGQGKVMVEACLKHGFFYVDNREGQVIDIKIADQLRDMSQKFFRLSTNDKNRYAIEKSSSLTGYVAFESMTNFVAHANESFFFIQQVFSQAIRKNRILEAYLNLP